MADANAQLDAAVEVVVEAPIKIECPLEGREEQYVLYKRRGWKFYHFRMWEEAKTGKLLEVICERIVDWKLYDENGKPILFNPWVIGENQQPTNQVRPDAFDGLDPALASWVVASFRMAYTQAGLPSPNS